MSHIRYLFICGALLVTGLFALYAWQEREQSYDNVVSHIWHRTTLLSEGTQRAFDNYETIIRSVGIQLVKLGTLKDPSKGRAYIEAQTKNHAFTVGYALARPDGQMIIMSDNPSYRSLPNLLRNPTTKDLFQKTLTSKKMQIGRPYKPKGFIQWIIPIRVPILDADGNVIAVALGALDIDGAGTMWSSIISRHELPIGYGTTEQGIDNNTRSLMVHEDRYLRYTGCAIQDVESRSIVYNTMVPAEVSTPNAFDDGPISKVVRPPDWYIRHCSNHEKYRIVVRQHIPKYKLFIISSYSYDAWKHSYIKSLFPVFMGYLLLLFMMLVSYRFVLRRQEEFETRTTYIARHDLLTGLPNQTQLLDRAAPVISLAHRENHLCAMLVIRIKNLGQITRTCGQPNTDKCVQELSRRFQKCLREEDTIARLGPNTFAAFFPHFDDETEPMEAAQRLLSTLITPVTTDRGERHTLHAAKGIALFPQDGRNADNLLSSAHLACDVALSSGTDAIVRFNSDFDTNANRQEVIISEIPKAITNKEIVVYFQPKIKTHDGSCTNFEALARWPNSSLGPIFPDEFIQIAEESGQINLLGEYILDLALAEIAHLSATCKQAHKISVNVSAKQFYQQNFIENISHALKRHKLPANCLTIEITESVMILDKTLIAETLSKLKRMGVGISIDDFGTGYSSLSYIHKLPITELKIDRSFITDMVNDEQNLALVKSIIALGKSLNVKTVAEGVETEEHVVLLTEFGCDELQGYYFSPPRPAQEMPQFLQQQNCINM